MRVRRVAQIGAGVVGGATGRALIHHGFDVVFVDVEPRVLDSLRGAGHVAIHPDEFDGAGVDAFLISVPSCLDGNPHGVEYVCEAATSLGRVIARKTEYSVVVVRSAVPPGTTEGFVVPILESHSGKRAGRDFGVAVNPEYLREKTAFEDFMAPRLVLVGALDDRSAEAVEALYGWVSCPVVRVSMREAEMQKFVHNVFNAAKISFFNEMRWLCRDIGAKADVVFPLVCLSAEGMWNPAYGTRDRGAFDGMCLPKDTEALYRWAFERGRELELVHAVLNVNDEARLGSVTREAAPQPGR